MKINKIIKIYILVFLTVFIVTCLRPYLRNLKTNQNFKYNNSMHYVGGEVNTFFSAITPSVGEIYMPVFVVTFPEQRKPIRYDFEEMLFGDYDSFSSFEKISSYGLLKVLGNTFCYEAENPMEYYENEDSGYELLAMEVLCAFDEEIDYSACDSNHDGIVDVFTINVIYADDFWYGCQAVWWLYPNFMLDNVHFGNYIINDAHPYDREYYISEMCHEFGHCMGLPDLYIPDTETDFEVMTGIAGTEMMEDMTGDYSLFSKLMLGWLTSEQVMIYCKSEENFMLKSSAEEGNCIIIPLDNFKDNDEFLSNYLLIEYDTAKGNYTDVLSPDNEGIRIFRVNAECIDNGFGERIFKYDMFSPQFDNRTRILSLVYEQERYYKTGDIINLNLEDEEVTVTICSIENGTAKIKISRSQ